MLPEHSLTWVLLSKCTRIQQPYSKPSSYTSRINSPHGKPRPGVREEEGFHSQFQNKQTKEMNNNKNKVSMKPKQEGEILYNVNSRDWRSHQTMEKAFYANDQNSYHGNGYITKNNLHIQCSSHNNSSNSLHRIKKVLNFRWKRKEQCWRNHSTLPHDM